MKMNECGIFIGAVQLSVEFLEQNLEVACAKCSFNLA